MGFKIYLILIHFFLKIAAPIVAKSYGAYGAYPYHAPVVSSPLIAKTVVPAYGAAYGAAYPTYLH